MRCNATGHFVTVRTDVAAVHCEHRIAAFPLHTYTGATTGHIACDISVNKCQIGCIFQSDSSTAIRINMCIAIEILCLVVCHISTAHRNFRGISTIEATAGFLRFISGDVTATDRCTCSTKQCHRTAAGIQRTRSFNTAVFYGTIARKHCRIANRKGTVLHINRAAVATVCAVAEKVAAIQHNTTALCINCATAALGVRPSRVAENITARYSNVSTLRINGSAPTSINGIVADVSAVNSHCAV